MQIFRHFEKLPSDIQGASVAIGNFDGMHLGHRTVIDKAGAIARTSNPAMPWGVLTFEPHPRTVFIPDQPPYRISPFRIKARHMEEMNIDFIVVLHFDRKFAAYSAQWFVNNVIIDGLKANHIIAGYDFVFGRNRVGNCQMLLEKSIENRFEFTCVPPITDVTEKAYSSTRVRAYIANGDLKAAATLLGRPFEIEGRVEYGNMRGRIIGFPTANLHLDEYIRPKLGVYAIRACIDQDSSPIWIDGVANLGNRPTFDGHNVLLEVHLFNWNNDLYGKHLRVALIDFIRSEIKFSNLHKIREQIAKDCKTAQERLAMC